MKVILIENSNLGSFCEKKYVKKGFYLNFLLKNFKSISINKNLNFKNFKKIKFYNILINKFLKLFYKKILKKIFIIKFYKNILKNNLLKILKKFGLNYIKKFFYIKKNLEFNYKIFYIKLINLNKINIYIKLILIK